ncbi:MAG: leucine-rich repeat domain-containing protein [Candidatus Heimdallarchaeota archaeon]|nr:MAG: leucine-rich repeat domain-containing protein [Candidatus Heimdallarchaeota archaeon]
MNWEKKDDGSEVARLEAIERALNIQFPVFTKQIKWNDLGVFIQNNCIHGLGFYSQNMDYIPKELWNFKNLEVLNLVNNGLIEIPEEIGTLSSLRVLYIGGNKIKLLPRSIKNLKDLIYFYLLEDNLLDVPKEIGDLTNLKELSIASKETDSIPDEIIKLKEKGCRIYFNNEEL